MNLKSAGGELLKDFGTMFSGAVRGVDQVIEAFGKNEARAAAEPLRDKYMAELAFASDVTKGRTATGPTAPAVRDPNQSIMDSSGLGGGGTTDSAADLKGADGDLLAEKRLPGPLKDLPARVGTMVAARESGKLTETDYYSRMVALAKDVRSRYPVGYREDIDSVFSKVTGGDPANLYIKSLLADISAATTKKDTELEHVRAQIRQLSNAGDVRTVDFLSKYIEHSTDPNKFIIAQGIIADANAYKYRAEYAKHLLEEAQAKGSIITMGVKDDFTAAATRVAGESFALTKAALDPSIPKDAFGGPIIPVDQQQAQISALAAQKLAAIEQMYALGNKMIGGKTTRDHIGESEFKKIVADKVALFDYALERANSKDFGSAYLADRLVKFGQSNIDLEIMNGPRGRELAVLKSIATASPEGFAKIMGASIIDKLPTDIGSYLTAQRMATITGDGKTAPVKPPAVTFAEMAKKHGTTPDHYEFMLKLYDSITDPTVPDEHKITLAKGIGDRGNIGFIESLGAGRAATYRRFTSPEMINEIHRLNGKEPGLFNQYKNWVDNTTRSLASTALREVSEAVQHIPPGSTFTWDDKNHRLDYNAPGVPQFNLVDVNRALSGNPRTARDLAARDAARNEDNIRIGRFTNKLGELLDPVRRVASKDPSTNVDAYMLEVLKASGVDLSKINGLPKSIADSVLASKREEERIKRMKEEDKK